MSEQLNLLNLQRVLHLSGNPYESEKSYDKIMDDIYWTFESNPLFAFEFRRDIINVNISISDSIYEKVKKNNALFKYDRFYL